MTDQELEEAHAERPGSRFEVKENVAKAPERRTEPDDRIAGHIVHLYEEKEALKQRVDNLAWFTVGGFLVVFVVLVAMGVS